MSTIFVCSNVLIKWVGEGAIQDGDSISVVEAYGFGKC